MTSNAELRSILREDGAEAFIVALAKSFPAVCKRVPTPWHSMRFRSSGIAASHGERCAVQFVLAVWNYSADWDHPDVIKAWLEETGLTEHKLGWNPSEAKLGKFDVIDALGVWDEENRAAFSEWAKEPIWP